MKNALLKKDHPFAYSCFSKCTEWKLNSTIVANKETYGIIINAKAYFFKKLGMSMLNNLHIKDNKIETAQQRQNEMKIFFDEKDSKEDFDLSDVKLPIDNTENNFILIESNMGKEENLNNIIFIEFDLKNSLINKDKLKHFVEVNNDFVDKEMFFVLNATIHGKPLFEKELKFSVETRKFIKSIQFKVENYKMEYLSKKSKEKIKNTFFTRIISNQNIGIEFYKNNFENLENYYTNFNTIVNSNFSINKIFLELCIPNKILKISSKFEENKTKEINDFTRKFQLGINGIYQNSDYLNPFPIRDANFNPSMKNRYNNPYINMKNKPNNEQLHVPSFQKLIPISNMNLQKIPFMEMSQKQRYDVMINPVIYNNFYIQQQQQFIKFNYAQYSMHQKINRLNDWKKNNVLSAKQVNTINLIQINEGACNFTIFLKSAKLFILKTEGETYKSLNLESFFKNFERISIFGLDVTYFFENSLTNVNYSATLSSMEIIINDPSTVETILNYLKKEEHTRFDNLISNNESFEYTEDDNYKLHFLSKENIIKLEFFEVKPSYSRYILIEEIQKLFDRFPVLREIPISSLSSNSWFSVLWTPMKSSNSKHSSTSFLIYYQFNLSESILRSQVNSLYMEIPIIGILPIKMDENIWLCKISQINYGYNYLNYDNDREYKQILLNSIENVFNFILNQTKKCSFDYNIYLKGQIN